MKSIMSKTAQKSSSKSLLQVIAALVMVLALAVSTTACSGASEPAEDTNANSGAAEQTVKEDTIKVTLVIDCKEAVEAGNETAIAASEDGVMFDGILELEEGATIYDAIVASGINFTSSDSSFGQYISAINGLASGDQGEMSGWIYTLNGEDVMVSASEQELKDGDTISWDFVLEPVYE